MKVEAVDFFYLSMPVVRDVGDGSQHTLSGIDVALWDLLGKKLGQPVYCLLGYRRAYPKIAYASQLFGNDAQTTLRKAQQVAREGFRPAKFGWGPYGRMFRSMLGELAGFPPPRPLRITLPPSRFNSSTIRSPRLWR